MQTSIQKITPFLWFDDQAEDAVRFYTSIFRNSGMGIITRYGKDGAQASGRPPGTVMTIAFKLEGQEFVALNGGPHFKFTEAISFVVNCASQGELDHYWDKLSAGGDERAQQCGWLKDKYGVSWQIVPAALGELLNDSDPERSGRVMKALLQMKKIDIEALQKASNARGTAGHHIVTRKQAREAAAPRLAQDLECGVLRRRRGGYSVAVPGLRIRGAVEGRG